MRPQDAKMTPSAPHGFLRVGAACPPVAVADPGRNAEQTVAFARRAGERGVQVLVLPELGLTGYTCGDLFFSLSTLVAGAGRAPEPIPPEAGSLPVGIVGRPPGAADRRPFNGP